MDYNQEYLNQLHDIFCEKFNDDELETLCFKARIHFDEFTGSTFKAKVLELIKYLERHQQKVLAIVDQGNKVRPDIAWPTTQFRQKAYSCERNRAFAEAIKIWEAIRDVDPLASSEIQRLQEELQKPKVIDPPSIPDVTSKSTDSKSTDSPNYKFLADNLRRGNIVVFLGAEVPNLFESKLRSPQEVVSSLAQDVDYNGAGASFAEVCEYWQTFGGSSKDTLCQRLQELVTPANHSVSISLYKLLAEIDQPLMVVSNCMSNWLELAFKGKKFVVLSHASVNDEMNTLLLEYSDRTETTAPQSITEEELSGLNLIDQGYSFIYKIRGRFQTTDSLLLTEADYFTFAKKRDKWIPNYVVKQLNRRGFWLFGHNPREWENYLILESVFEKRRGRERPLAFQATHHPFAIAYWEAKGIKNYVVNFNDFVDNLKRYLGK